MAVTEGKKAPAFTLKDQDGKSVRLEDFTGKPVVLYFYPKDDTPGCTTQACAIRDNWSDFKKKGIVVLGVSPDDPESHTKFAGKYDLPFTLLADAGHKISEKYGVWKEKSMYGRKYFGIERSTFVIGPDGKVVKIFRKVKPAEHVDLVMGALKDTGLTK